MGETEHQKKVVKALRRAGILVAYVPNEIPQEVPHAIRAKLLRERYAMGLLKGMPDLLVLDPPPVGGYVGTALEMKSPKGRVSKHQDGISGCLQLRGWAVVVGWGWENALEELRKLGYAV